VGHCCGFTIIAVFALLTILELGKFALKKRYTLPTLAKFLQLHNSPINCARELFKPSQDLASLLVYNEKKFLGCL